MTLSPRPQQHAVVAAADEITALVRRLRGDLPAGILGIARAARLVDDRSGPLYRHDAGDLDQAIASARTALDGTKPIATEPVAQAA